MLSRKIKITFRISPYSVFKKLQGNCNTQDKTNRENVQLPIEWNTWEETQIQVKNFVVRPNSI